MKKIDHTSFNNPGTDGERLQKRWWLASKEERPQAIMHVVESLSKYDSKRQTQYQTSTRMYGNLNLMGLSGLSYSKNANTLSSSLRDRVTYNVVQATIDTVTAKIAKNRPKPMFLTSGGDWNIQRKAKKLEKFIDGVFYENKTHELAVDVFRDGAILGDGLVQVYRHYDKVKFDRVLASELYVDWVEAQYGFPRQLHRLKSIDREVLLDMFPSKKALINDADSASADLTGAYQNVADHVTVVESWHLPSGPDAGDGIHTINIAKGNLFEEEWTKDHFPFAKFTWSKRQNGYWGQGAAEQAQGLQLEINKILFIIQRSMHLAGSFKVLVEASSKIVKEHLNNDIGAIVMYQGTPPQYVVPPVVPVEYYQHLQNLKNAAFEQVGVSQLSAASVKPAGLDSGKALREYNNIESDRFMTIGKAYEAFHLELASLALEVAKEIYEDTGSYEVRTPDKKFVSSINWKDVNMEEDEYIMKMFPVSSLPNDPEGRLQTIQEYIQAGFINPRTGRKLLDFPDLEQVEDLQNAEEDYINQVLEKMVDDGEFTPPEPFDNLDMARELALEYYAQGKLNGLDEERLDLIRRFIGQIDVLTAKAFGALAPPPGSMQPQAAPEPQPTSPMVQNQPGIPSA